LTGQRTTGESVTAILVAALPKDADPEKAEESFDELAALADTAGVSVAGRMSQNVEALSPATLLGKGKVEQLAGLAGRLDAGLVIFDNPITVTQQERLEELLGVKVIDRTALILEIFAQHAHTSEGRTQVELAQLSYLLPRIRGRGTEMSRLGGGIGTRMGPGETKLEADRRRIRRRMRKLEGDLEHMEAARTTQRKQRVRSGLASVCLVGYTNSGKSTLINRLTGADVKTEDQLFSTLDSTTRRIELRGGRAVISDTVGFIKDLPHELVAAFRSTLEVVREADLLLHVVDAAGAGEVQERIDAVRAVLREIDSGEIPAMLVFNKADLLEAGQKVVLQRLFPGSLTVSALTGEGADALVDAFADRLFSMTAVTLVIGEGDNEALSSIYRDGRVKAASSADGVIRFEVELPAAALGRYSDYIDQKMPETPKNWNF